jgi:hypothetical protein
MGLATNKQKTIVQIEIGKILRARLKVRNVVLSLYRLSHFRETNPLHLSYYLRSFNRKA